MIKDPYRGVSPEVAAVVQELRGGFDEYHATHHARLARTLQVLVENAPTSGKLLELGTSGFLPATALVPVPVVVPRPEDWLGTWSRNAEAEITITKGEGGKLVIAGYATYGGHDPGRVARGAINVGELEGEAMPKGNRVFFGDGYSGEKSPHDFGECQARLQLFGRYLVVEDSGGCGGMNVRFNGVYVRLK